MECPVCKQDKTPDSYSTDKGGIHYEINICPECGYIFPIVETKIDGDSKR